MLQLIADPAKWAAGPAKETLVGGAKRSQQAAEAIRSMIGPTGVNMLAPERNVENEFVR